MPRIIFFHQTRSIPKLYVHSSSVLAKIICFSHLSSFLYGISNIGFHPACSSSHWYALVCLYRAPGNILLNTCMSLVLDLGDHAIDYTSLAKTEHLSAIELEVRKLLDKLSGVRAETAYQVL